MNVWKTVRVILNEFCSETLGTFILLFFGVACGCSWQSGGISGYFEQGIVWGIAFAVAILASAPVSSAHLNPAITFATTFSGKLPLWKVLHFVTAQFVGAFIGAAAAYSVYFRNINNYEFANSIIRGETGSSKSGIMFYCRISNKLSTPAHAFYIEIFISAIFLLIIGFLNDKTVNHFNGYGVFFPALMIGLTVSILTAAFGPLTSACLNPIRDIAPRFFAYLAGWGPAAMPGEALNPIWPFVIGPIIGAIIGACLWEYWGSKMYKYVVAERQSKAQQKVLRRGESEYSRICSSALISTEQMSIDNP